MEKNKSKQTNDTANEIAKLQFQLKETREHNESLVKETEELLTIAEKIRDKYIKLKQENSVLRSLIKKAFKKYMKKKTKQLKGM